MGISNLSFSATNINVGLDADKSATPRAGDMYLATDTEFLYKCYTDDAWVSDELTEAKIDTAKANIAKSISGSYTGNATVNRAIPHGATKPKFVFITDKEAGVGAKIILSDVYCMGILDGVSPNARGVTVPDDTNFYVGNAANYDSSANANNHPYEWTAIL